MFENILVGLILAILAVMVLGFIFVQVDESFGEEFDVFGVVVEKDYSPGGSSTGVGVAGSGGVVVTSNSWDEKYTLLVDVEGRDDLQTACVESSDYKKAKKGTKIALVYARGKFTGHEYGPNKYRLI